MSPIVIIAVAGLFAFLRYTRVGVRIRAGTLDLETVSALGVNVGMLRSFNFDWVACWRASPECSPPARSASIRTWATTC